MNNTRPDWVNHDLYRLLYGEDLIVAAYERIKSKPGNMTAGTDGKTLDGFSMDAIHDIIGKLRDESFQFKSSRREFIPKANSKMRPPPRTRSSKRSFTRSSKRSTTARRGRRSCRTATASDLAGELTLPFVTTRASGRVSPGSSRATSNPASTRSTTTS
jgi:hypothetical protein